MSFSERNKIPTYGNEHVRLELRHLLRRCFDQVMDIIICCTNMFRFSHDLNKSYLSRLRKSIEGKYPEEREMIDENYRIFSRPRESEI